MIYEDESLLWKLTKNAAIKVGSIYGTFYLIDKFLPTGSMSSAETLKLYKTGEKHSNGSDVYRVVGDKPKRSKFGLGGKYYIGVDIYPNVKKIDGNWTDADTGKILSSRLSYYLEQGMPIGEMYATGKPYKDEFGYFDGEPEYQISNYVVIKNE